MTTATNEFVVRAVEPVVEKNQEAETGSELAALLDGDVVARLTGTCQGIEASGS